ncbi:unnamed protein product [Gongylonema pulchrum]|uniref:TPH domain-containing protein n=1 Tax=Gongylonema pulchrum TaxID=637853 RepID=A0A183D2P0_9BILA|nr:unnamed protein product [Gongylonema pulchrum]
MNLLKKENELHRIDQERRTVERFKETLVSRERAAEKKLQEELKRAREQNRVHMAQMVSEWNQKEAALVKRCDAVWARIREISEKQELEQVKKFENEELRKKLGRQETSISNLKKQLKLVEESAAIRINDLKFHHRLTVRHFFDRCNLLPLADLESVSTSTPSESSFEQNFRDRMNAIELSKQVKLKIGVALVLWLTGMSVCITVRK